MPYNRVSYNEGVLYTLRTDARSVSYKYATTYLAHDASRGVVVVEGREVVATVVDFEDKNCPAASSN